MNEKITWEKIYLEFKNSHPSSRNYIDHYHPYDYAKIKLYFKDGSEGVYDYDSKHLEIIKL